MFKVVLLLILLTGGTAIPATLLADAVDSAPDEPVAPPRGTESSTQPGRQTGKPHPQPESRQKAPTEGKTGASSKRLRNKRE